MLSPQCAAALADEALRWLQQLPSLQQGLLAACSSLAVASGDGGLQGRDKEGAAATAASAGVLLSTLAAALHFLGSYWRVQVWHTAAERAAAAVQLQQLGLLPPASGDGSSAAILPTVSGMLQLVVDSAWPPSPAAAAALTAGAAELAVALARLANALLPRQQAAVGAAVLLAPLCSQHAADRFVRAAADADATLLQPWDCARQQQLLHLVRAAAAGVQAAAACSQAASSTAGDRVGQPLLPAAAASTAQALLLVAPPGDEPAALQLMALLLAPRQLACTASAAAEALAAMAGTATAELVGSSAPPPPAVPDVQHVSRLLLAGYAAAWLGLVPQQVALEDEGEGGPPEDAAQLAQSESPPGAAWLQPRGEAV